MNLEFSDDALKALSSFDEIRHDLVTLAIVELTVNPWPEGAVPVGVDSGGRFVMELTLADDTVRYVYDDAAEALRILAIDTGQH